MCGKINYNNVSEIEFSIKGFFSLVSIFVLASHDVFVHTHQWYFAVKCILVLAWLSKSKDPMLLVVSLASYENQFLIGLVGQPVKPNGV